MGCWKVYRRGMNPSLEGAAGRESFQELMISELRPEGWIGASLGRSQGGVANDTIKGLG